MKIAVVATRRMTCRRARLESGEGWAKRPQLLIEEAKGLFPWNRVAPHCTHIIQTQLSQSWTVRKSCHGMRGWLEMKQTRRDCRGTHIGSVITFLGKRMNNPAYCFNVLYRRCNVPEHIEISGPLRFSL